ELGHARGWLPPEALVGPAAAEELAVDEPGELRVRRPALRLQRHLLALRVDAFDQEGGLVRGGRDDGRDPGGPGRGAAGGENRRLGGAPPAVLEPPPDRRGPDQEGAGLVAVRGPAGGTQGLAGLQVHV